MGRLPKGFKKGMLHKPDESEEQQLEQTKAAPSVKKDNDAPNPAFLKTIPAATPESKPAPVGSSSTATAQDADSDNDSSDAEGHKGPESRGHMIQRHKKEMQAFKKNLQRMGKKSKDEIAKMTADIEARHAKELADIDAGQKATAGVNTAEATAGVAKLGVADADDDDDEEEGSGAKGGAKMTKAMKRKQKLAAAEAEREARIAAEAAEAGPSARAVEEQALAELLIPLGLKMREIRADGHCLYRSLEDQLTLCNASQAMDYQQLRGAAAKHIRQHAQEYQHYMDVHDGEEAAAAVERYCTELETTAVWGGQLELSVLAQVLRRPIKVHTVGLPPLILGEEFNGSAEPLQVCYLRHAFGLGEHYNSLQALAAT